MESDGRDTSWRQGDVVSAADLCKLVGEIDRPDQAIGVVISHDCDLANTAEKEPHVEVIVARPIERLGQNAHAKKTRGSYTFSIYRAVHYAVLSFQPLKNFLFPRQIFWR